MFCPNCSVYLQEQHLIKKNVKRFDNIEIEYDARCPACEVEIGHMFWGTLTPAEHLPGQVRPSPIPPQPQEDAPAPPSPPREGAPVGAEPGKVSLDWPQPSNPDACACPHCHKPLPSEYQRIDPPKTR